MKTMTRILIAGALLAPSALFAQTSADPAAVQAGDYVVETNHTLVQFSVNHFGFNNYLGTLPGATGTLHIEPKALASTKLDVNIPVARLSTTNDVLDGELKSAEWFDAAQYPTMHFVSQQVVKTGANTARISGTLTMHGVTKPLVLNATFGGAGVNPLDKAFTIGFQATGKVKRSDYGVTKYVPLVGDEVTFVISAAFEKKQ